MAGMKDDGGYPGGRLKRSGHPRSSPIAGRHAARASGGGARPYTPGAENRGGAALQRMGRSALIASSTGRSRIRVSQLTLPSRIAASRSSIEPPIVAAAPSTAASSTACGRQGASVGSGADSGARGAGSASAAASRSASTKRASSRQPVLIVREGGRRGE